MEIGDCLLGRRDRSGSTQRIHTIPGYVSQLPPRDHCFLSLSFYFVVPTANQWEPAGSQQQLVPRSCAKRRSQPRSRLRGTWHLTAPRTPTAAGIPPAAARPGPPGARVPAGLPAPPRAETARAGGGAAPARRPPPGPAAFPPSPFEQLPARLPPPAPLRLLPQGGRGRSLQSPARPSG